MIDITIDEHLNKATGLIVEAGDILNDVSVREKMKRGSYLGEMSDRDCYNVALGKAKEAVDILIRFNGVKLPDAENLVIQIENVLNPPVPVKPKTVKKRIPKGGRY